MELTSLETFREVARRGSFTAAGNAPGYSQSAVSRQIHALEGDLGGWLTDLATKSWIAGSTS